MHWCSHRGRKWFSVSHFLSGFIIGSLYRYLGACWELFFFLCEEVGVWGQASGCRLVQIFSLFHWLLNNWNTGSKGLVHCRLGFLLGRLLNWLHERRLCRLIDAMHYSIEGLLLTRQRVCDEHVFSLLTPEADCRMVNVLVLTCRRWLQKRIIEHVLRLCFLLERSCLGNRSTIEFICII